MKRGCFHITLKLLIIPLLLLAFGVYGQPHVLKVYTANDGLPGTLTHSVYQDKYGYLWIGSGAGLSRFDGRQFVNYSLEDGLPSLYVGQIFEDSQGRLWVCTSSGPAQFKNNRFITYPKNDHLGDTYAFHLFETSDKKIWMTSGTGVYEFAGNMWKKIRLVPGFENSPCRFVVPANGELYVCYSTDIFCRTKRGEWLHIASRKNYGILFNSMSVQKNEIWVSTESRIYIIRNHQLVPLFRDAVRTNNFFSFFIDSKNRLIISGGDFLKMSKPGDWGHFTDSLTQFGYQVAASEDSSRNIWSSTNSGLVKIRDMAFESVDQANSIPLDGIYNFITLPGNRIIVSSGIKNGMQLYANGKLAPLAPPAGPGNRHYYVDPVDGYTFDDKKSLWLVTRFKRFLHFNGKTFDDFSHGMHLKTDEGIYDVDYIKSRRQFFICADSTLLYGAVNSFSTFIPKNTGVPIIKPLRLLEMQDSLMLVYIDRKGLYFIDTANNLVSLYQKTGVDGAKNKNQLGVTLIEDPKNTVWVAVNGLGLYQYGLKARSPYFKTHIDVKDGLQSNNVLSILTDLQGRVWVSTNAGIDILQKNKSGRWEVFNYAKTEDLGITVSEFGQLRRDSGGNIWLSSPNKLIKFNPAIILLDKQTPHIVIEKVALAFKETNWSKLSDSLYSYFQLPYQPVLSYSQNSLGVFFNAVDLSVSNSNPEYSYKLLGLDTGWSIPSKAKSVSFERLPPGRYQFEVRAKDRASGWSRPAVFIFTIAPPFWGLWWFRLVVLLIAAFIIVSIFRARIRKIKNDASIENQLKELEMKALKAQMNPHFIYNALNSIQALVANDKTAEGVYYIGSFSRLLRQVLDNSENNVISLDKELETIGLYIQLESLRLDMQLQYEKIVPENVVPEFEKIPPLILQPFVENALWHGLSRKEGEKEIEIAVCLDGNWLVCNVTDNGIGRVKAQHWKKHSTAVHQSKGIDITRKRLIDYNDDSLVTPIEFFDLYDDENKPAGTRVTVRIVRKFNLH